MADSIRMIDLAGLTRGLDEFRRMDPEQRALADRLAARAAARQRDEVHEDVANAEGPTRTRIDEHHGQGPDHDRRRGRDHREEEATKDASPEREEGLLLDIKV
jgi:hypothetical protein